MGHVRLENLKGITMEAIVRLLPTSWQPKAKALVTVISIVLTVVVAAVPVLPKWATIVVAVLSGLMVYQTPAVGYVGPVSDPPPSP